MRIAILSRNKELHSIRRLLQEAKKLRVQCDVIDPLECQLILDGQNSRIVVGTRTIAPYDAVLPRIGASITDYGLAVVEQFEMMGTFVINSSRAIAESRNKMRSLQVLSEAGLIIPATVLTRSQRGIKMAAKIVKGMPVVLKVLQGTQGVGVMLVHTPISMSSVMDTLHGLNQDVMIQQFILEGAGRDYRIFVIGKKVIAAMMRTAPQGEFRSNLHRGGEAKLVRLPKAYERAAVKAVQKLGLQIAGVDIMESNAGPMIIEVNSSPGFEGIERATKLNIANAIVKHIVSEARKAKRQSKRAFSN
ncbi:MAG: hypothetical protein A3K03_00270 [Bdellovibrionales bacterium RIFOXYD1_FULL_44_7]|nr:MAG: hypothetical protein A3K03_00270 [Bdellovibrionales bacterium RIFOXYD1_FULL_44_7]